MKPDEFDLDRTLKSAPVPERSPEYWEKFPKRVTAEIRQRRAEQNQVANRATMRTWAFALAAACLMAGFIIGFHHGGKNGQNELAQSREIYREVSSMFPNQVRAIMSDRNGVRLVLSEKQDVPSSPPIYVKICRENRCQTIVTFSGQQVQINGETFDVLTDARGNILLIGSHTVWSSQEPAPSGGYHIEAQQLGERI